MLTETHTAPDHFRAVHRQMRLDIGRSLQAVERVSLSDRDGRLRPLARWTTGFIRELHLHHGVEDRVFFPALAARCPEVGPVLAALEADHREVDVLLARWAPAVRRLADRAEPFAPARDEVVEVVGRIRALLGPHLDLEDDEVVPRLRDRFSPAELEALDQEVARVMPRTGLSFTLPWNLCALPPEVREEVRAGAPVALRVVDRLTRAHHERLVAAAFAGIPAVVRT